MVEDDNIPSSYSNSVEDVTQQLLQAKELLAQQRIKRDQHWNRLRRAREVCPNPNTYHVWLEEQWGLKVILDRDSMITSEHYIVDEAKYLLYLLKFGSP